MKKNLGKNFEKKIDKNIGENFEQKIWEKIVPLHDCEKIIKSLNFRGELISIVTRVNVSVKILAFRSGFTRNKYQCDPDTYINYLFLKFV